jgi:DNA-binding MarR family transcriptional regulator
MHCHKAIWVTRGLRSHENSARQFDRQPRSTGRGRLRQATAARGIQIEQFHIFEVLDTNDPRAMGEIAAAALIEIPALTKIIDKMTMEALVYRSPDPDDRRG